LDEKAVKKIYSEMSNINQLFEAANNLFEYCRNNYPDFEKTSAAALTFHSFYNGIENILLIIAKSYNADLPKGNDWHTQLFNNSFVGDEYHGKIFDMELKPKLKEYLTFRHFLRHTYGFLLDPDKLKPLLWNIDEVWTKVQQNLQDFITKN